MVRNCEETLREHNVSAEIIERSAMTGCLAHQSTGVNFILLELYAILTFDGAGELGCWNSRLSPNYLDQVLFSDILCCLQQILEQLPTQ